MYLKFVAFGVQNCSFLLLKKSKHINSIRLTHKFVRFKLISASDLGESILHLKENGSAEQSSTDILRKGVVIAKLCSLGSSSLGVIMMPILNSKLWENATEKPSTMVFVVLANLLLSVLTFTPLLLHFLAKRFISNVYYNEKTKIFTTVHYNFFLQKRALRFLADDVVDSVVAVETKKLWIPLATCFVGSMPLLLSLDHRQYSNKEAFNLLTKNINIPIGSD